MARDCSALGPLCGVDPIGGRVGDDDRVHADNAAVSNRDVIAQRGVDTDEAEIPNPHGTADDDVPGDKAM